MLFFFYRCHTNIQMEVLMKEPSEHSHVLDPDRLTSFDLKKKLKFVVHHQMKDPAQYYLMHYVQFH